MVKKIFFILATLVLIVSSLLFVSAVIFTEAGSVTNPDNFYSPYETWINVSTNATITGAGDSIVSVKANFSAINATACGNGYLNLSYINGYWIGNCSVASFFTNASQITPIQKNITFVVENATGNFSSLQQIGSPVVIMLHNLGVPNMSDGAGCKRFGLSTTNLSSTSVTNFANVSNYLISIQINFTCQTNGAFNGSIPGVFNDVLLLNFTSINMTSSDIGTKLSNLYNTVQVNITWPKTFGASIINVNTTAFSELNSFGWATLYNLPFVSLVEAFIGGDNIAKLYGFSRMPNGYSSTLGISTMNLSLYIAGFSGYNVSDNSAPVVSLISPSNSATNITNFRINVSVNGTGTEPSKITINITNSSGQINFTSYNSSTNTANCVAATQGGELYYCAFNISLGTGNYTLNITAWDYGGASPGNVNTLSQSLYVDQTAPTISLGTTHTDSSITWTIGIDSTGSEITSQCVASGSVAWSLSGNGSTQTASKTGLSCDTTYEIFVNCTDSAGNFANMSGSHKTSECSSDDGGGGGAEYTAPFWTMTYSPSENELESGYSKQLLKKERVRIIIDKEYHYVGIIDLSSDEITINVSSTPQTASMAIGETKKFEVTDDDYFDLSVKLNSIDGSKANLTISSIYEKMTAEEVTESAAAKSGSSAASETTGEEVAAGGEIEASVPFYKKFWFWAIFVLILAAIGAAVYLKIISPKMIQRSIRVVER